VWSWADKVQAAIVRSKGYMPAALAAQVDMLQAPENFAIMTGTIVIWAESHFFGVREVSSGGCPTASVPRYCGLAYTSTNRCSLSIAARRLGRRAL
jgi:hypothetical protein